MDLPLPPPPKKKSTAIADKYALLAALAHESPSTLPTNADDSQSPPTNLPLPPPASKRKKKVLSAQFEELEALNKILDRKTAEKDEKLGDKTENVVQTRNDRTEENATAAEEKTLPQPESHQSSKLPSSITVEVKPEVNEEQEEKIIQDDEDNQRSRKKSDEPEELTTASASLDQNLDTNIESTSPQPISPTSTQPISPASIHDAPFDQERNLPEPPDKASESSVDTIPKLKTDFADTEANSFAGSSNDPSPPDSPFDPISVDTWSLREAETNHSSGRESTITSPHNDADSAHTSDASGGERMPYDEGDDEQRASEPEFPPVDESVQLNDNAESTEVLAKHAALESDNIPKERLKSQFLNVFPRRASDDSSMKSEKEASQVVPDQDSMAPSRSVSPIRPFGPRPLPDGLATEDDMIKATMPTTYSSFGQFFRDKFSSAFTTKQARAEGVPEPWEFWGKFIDHPDAYLRGKDRKVTISYLVKGIPPSIRGLVWMLVSDSKNHDNEIKYGELRTLESSYERIIRRDLARTFPNEPFFQDENGEGQESLLNVLKAYSLYDDEVGYCQGLSFLCGLLLLNMPDNEAFCTLIQLMHRYTLRGHYTPKMDVLQSRLYIFDRLLSDQCPSISSHLAVEGIRSSMYASQWFLTLYLYRFPLTLATRIVDLLFFEGVEILFQVAIWLMRSNEKRIIQLEFEPLLNFLKDTIFEVITGGDMESFLQEVLEIRLSKRKMDKYSKDYSSLSSTVTNITSPTPSGSSDMPPNSNKYTDEDKDALHKAQATILKQAVEMRRLESALTVLNREHIEMANQILLKNMSKHPSTEDLAAQSPAEDHSLLKQELEQSRATCQETERRCMEVERDLIDAKMELATQGADADDQAHKLRLMVKELEAKDAVIASCQSEIHALKESLASLKTELVMYKAKEDAPLSAKSPIESIESNKNVGRKTPMSAWFSWRQTPPTDEPPNPPTGTEEAQTTG